MGITTSLPQPVWNPDPPSTYRIRPVQTVCRNLKWPVLHRWFGAVEASIDQFRTVIERENEMLTGADMPVAEIVIPRHRFNMRHDRALDFKAVGFAGGFAGATVVLQSSIGNGSVFLPMETIYLTIRRDVPQLVGSVNPKGYRAFEAALVDAGSKGYTFTCVIDTPTDAGFVPNSLPNFTKQYSPLHIVCQRPAGMPLERIVHKIARIRVRTKNNCCDSGYTSVADELAQTMSTFLTKGWRLAGAHSPPYYHRGVTTSYLTELVLVFVYTGIPYLFTFVDVPVQYRDDCGSTCLGNADLDHNAYMEAIGVHGKVGWQLAAMVDVPKKVSAGCQTVYEMKMILQAPVDGGKGGSPAYPKMNSRSRGGSSYSSTSTGSTYSGQSKRTRRSKKPGVKLSYAREEKRMKEEMMNAPEVYPGRKDWRGFPMW